MKEELTIDMYYEYRLLKGKIIQCKNAYEENTPTVSCRDYNIPELNEIFSNKINSTKCLLILNGKSLQIY